MPSSPYVDASFRGKDLLEATFQSKKACFEFKSLIENISKLNSDIETTRKMINDFAYFVYGDKKRADFFVNEIMKEFL